MKKNRKLWLTIVGVSLSVFIGFYYWLTTSTEPQSASGAQSEVYKEFAIQDAPAEQLFPDDLSEYAVQIAIHHMSHQKIKAEDKWGKLQLTEERVDRLFHVVQKNQHYKFTDLYIDILERWRAGDFSRADDDHNIIWELQNGTIGRATGLLTPEEELKYIEKNFKK